MSGDTVVQRPLCASVCEDVVRECREEFESQGTTLPNCTGLTNSSVEVQVNNKKYRVKCFEVDNNQGVPEFPFKCSWPMADNPNAEPFPCSGNRLDPYFLLFFLLPTSLVLHILSFVTSYWRTCLQFNVLFRL